MNNFPVTVLYGIDFLCISLILLSTVLGHLPIMHKKRQQKSSIEKWGRQKSGLVKGKV